LKDKQVGIHI